MDNATKQRIIEFNRRLGLKTEFITAEEGMLGYAQNNTIYINESVEQDYERTNMHEILHFFENTPEFENLKKTVLSSVDKRLDQIRAEYELRYFGIYSEDEIKAGVLDNEIVIDLLVDNSIIEYENGLVVGDRLLGDIERGLEERRYLNMSIRRNVQSMNLSDWEKIFVENYYDGKEHILPQADKSRGIKREDAIRQDIGTYLEQLYAISEEDFIIDPHSPEVIREYEGEIKALQARGEDVSPLQYNKEMALQRIADEHSKHLYEEYKHIVDQIKGMNFEPSFKSLMLRETLTKTYKLEKDDDGKKTIVKNRDMHKSIASHMILNEETLSFIYQHRDNLEEYSNFANLYFAALEVYNKSIAEKSGISLEGVDTYGMGQWIKFDGKESNVEEYLENAERLAALVKDTPWCTKTLASSQLAEGDFYVFVDNEGQPHIAVRMSGNQIEEVRGIANGWAQELEEEYRDVAISFLENNKEIKNGKEWLENAEWNKRLVEYRRKIEEGTLTVEDLPLLMEDLHNKGFRVHGENQNRIELQNSLYEIDHEIIKDGLERAEELGLVGLAYDLIKATGDLEYTKQCIERSKELRLGGLEIYDLIKIIGEPEYTKQCIERAEELELPHFRVYYLIKATEDNEFIKQCIEKYNELGLTEYHCVSLIKEIRDPEYIKQCIERAEKLGLPSPSIYDLIKEIRDSEYTKQCIERAEELGLSGTEISHLIKEIRDPEYTKQCIERAEELGLSGSGIYYLIIEIRDPEYIKQCIERYKELLLELNSEDLCDLIKATEDTEYMKLCIEQYEELGIEDGYYLEQIIEATKDPEYIKQCVERYEELELYEMQYMLIGATGDIEYIRECMDRQEEFDLYDDEIEFLKTRIAEIILQTNDYEHITQYLEENEDVRRCIEDDSSLRKRLEEIKKMHQDTNLALEIFEANPNIQFSDFWKEYDIIPPVVNDLNIFLSSGKPIESIVFKSISTNNHQLYDSFIVINGEKFIPMGYYDVSKTNSGLEIGVENTNNYPLFIPREFDRIKEEALKQNPDTRIKIEGRSIIISDGKKEVIYLIDDENNRLVLADEIETVDFIVPEKFKNEHQIDEVAQFADTEVSVEAEEELFREVGRFERRYYADNGEEVQL